MLFLTQLNLAKKRFKAIDALAFQRYKNITEEDPSSVVVHRDLDYSDDEKEGIHFALSNVDKVDLVHIKGGTTSRMLTDIGSPPRGLFKPINEHVGVLYTTGKTKTDGTYPGIGTPSPLEIVRCDGDTAIDVLSKQAFSLTKMDWNTTRVMISEPVTIKYAKR